MTPFKGFSFFRMNGKDYLCKANWSENSYVIIITDLSMVWEECLQQNEIMERNTKLNPSLECSCERLIKQLATEFIVEKDELVNCSLLEEHSSIFIESKYSINNFPFHWNFDLKPRLSEKLLEYVTIPLIGMISSLQNQVNELKVLIERKDAEINDYKMEGAQISRKYLETKRFDEKDMEAMQTSSEILVPVIDCPMKVFSDKDFSHEYQCFLVAKDKLTEIQKEKEETEKIVVEKIVPENIPVSSVDHELDRRKLLAKKVSEDKKQKEYNRQKKRKCHL